MTMRFFHLIQVRDKVLRIRFEDILFLGALNRYFIQLISCGDDYQFQELIRGFLPLLIRSIEIQTEDFRKKVRKSFYQNDDSRGSSYH